MAVAATLSIMLAGITTSPADASGGPRQTAAYTFTTSTPGAPTGYRFAVDFQNPTDPSGKPYSVAEWIIELPAGTTLDNQAIPQCTASDAQLYAQGASACPAASRVGGGTIITDFGSPGGLPRYGDNTVSQFNGNHEYIGYAETQNPPTRAVSRTAINGETLTSPIPTFPGFPPPDPYLAFRSVRLSGPAIVNDGRATAQHSERVSRRRPLDDQADVHLSRRRIANRHERLALSSKLTATRRPRAAAASLSLETMRRSLL